MSVQLSEFEIDILNLVIPTQTMSDAQKLQMSLREIIGEQKETIMAKNNLSEQDFKTVQTQTAKNIFVFLKENAFIGEREGQVYFLTDKGKHLKKQRSLQQYYEWQKEERAKNKVIINTIETRGYLDQDQVKRSKRSILIQKIKKYVIYPLLFIIVVAVIIGAAKHYKIF